SYNVGASYPVLVHRLALLLHASFGPSVAGTPLRFANPSPPSGWVEDFHFQTAGHAQHTLLSRDSSRLSSLFPENLPDPRERRTRGHRGRLSLVERQEKPR